MVGSFSKGRFITIEGADGAGKSTQLETIKAYLTDHNITVVQTREPGGTPIGERLRSLLLGEGELEIGDDAELLMVFAARAEHIRTVILPALVAGNWVLSDRFTDASYAYQGARGISAARIGVLENWVQAGLQPDLTLLFDLPIETGLARVGQRGAADRFEQESRSYKHRVQEIYLQRAAADPQRIKIVDASASIQQVSGSVVKQLQAFL